ncbi:NACHT domain-containing protein [Serratia marcescens]|uniref:NACHT domain-containing protein n=1 Tax=Serratia marcescens TaxID=615 RepID=UPI003AFB6FF0
MFNRHVRQIHPQEDKESQTMTFGDYLESPNIVLLGDPGAGKTHLFKQFAALDESTYLTVRHFISGVPIDNQKTLFIDALDEKRSNHSSSDVVDNIVQRLFSLPPQKLRISCRSQDWLGDSDLSAFLPYFERTGGYVVLHLQQLSREEQTAILHANSIEQPEKFLEEAEKHSAYEFLHNPQNLLMLAESVRDGNWPQTRFELFNSATQFLLTEHSREHTRKNLGVYASNELEGPAGAICALRMLSDISGISLLPNDIRPEYPSYRTIPFFSNEVIRGALSRRVFIAGDELETVDYSHRTIAEYLAARWLARIVEQGLPLGRLRSLLGYEGYPSSELRGLHAWLAVFLPQHANIFINADPYGVLVYGDAASLSATDKQILLKALSKLSENDPWFRNHGYLSSYLKGFVSGEMEILLRTIINDPHSQFSLRMIVLESLSVTTPIPALNGDLIKIVISECFSYAEKEEAITALVHSGASGQAAVVSIFYELRENNHDNTRLRNHIIQLLYKEHFSPLDVAQLLIDTLSITNERLPIGALWGLTDIIPDDDLLAIFEYLYQYHSENMVNWHSFPKNHHEVVYFLESGLLYILNRHGEYNATQIWVCLNTLYSYSDYHHSYASMQKPIVEKLNENLWKHEDIIDAAIISLAHYDTGYSFLYEFNGSTLGVISNEIILSRFIHHLSANEFVPAKIALVYRLAFYLLYSCEVPSQGVFEFLSSYRDVDMTLNKIFDDAVVCEIEDWRVEQNIRRGALKNERQLAINNNKYNFDICRQKIISGSHLNWLKHIAYVYYAKYSDVNKKITPIQRLSSVLGCENVADAISGLIAILNNPALPTVDDVVCSLLKGKYCEWWFAILAGSDELFKIESDITQWSDDLLKSLMALDTRLSITVKKGNVASHYVFPWKEYVIHHRVDLFIDTYRYIVDSSLNNNLQFIRALNYLLNESSLLNCHIAPLVMELLSKYPDDTNHLQNMVEWALAYPPVHAELLQLSKTMLTKQFVLKKLNFQVWLVCCYILSHELCSDLFIAETKSDPEVIGLVRKLSSKVKICREDSEQTFSLIQLETICKVAAVHFPNTYHPGNESGGSRNNFGYAEYIRSLISDISSLPSFEARETLARLLFLPEFKSYRDHILHAKSNQMVRYRESQFHHADWKQAVSTLMNKVPSNVMDLYSLLLEHIRDISNRVAYENTNMYKQFWNEDSYGRALTPKPEESCRNIFLDLLRARLNPLKISCEPEGHMVSDKRADIIVSLPGIKIPIEIKRDYHRDVWTALNGQLDKLYTKNPDAAGYGIYLIFWFGSARPNALRRLSKKISQPENASAMENMLNETVPVEKRERLSAMVIDVSGEVMPPAESSV